MSQKYDSDLRAAILGRDYALFNFIDIEVSTPIYLTDYHGDITLFGNDYVSTVLKGVERPPRTGSVSQEVQKIAIAEVLNGFTSSDFISSLGADYFGARVYARTLVEGSTLLTATGDWLWASDGVLKKVYREGTEVILEVMNGSEQLGLRRELRTTRGSLARLSTTDTSFNRADGVDNNIALEWG